MESGSAKPPSYIQIQFAFTNHIRKPEEYPLPAGIDGKRMEVYLRLFANNIERLLSNNFPVLRKILPADQWRSLNRTFFTNHRSKSPYFAEIPLEFIAYLRDERTPVSTDPPFLLELAHYEWVELALSIAEGDTPSPDEQLLSDPLGCNITLSRLAWPLAYQFPVHRISPDYQPDAPPPSPTFLAVYRNDQDNVRFLEINQITHRLMDLLKEERTGESVISQIAEELGMPAQEQLLGKGEEILKKLAHRRLILRI
ncbi:MAG: putative DNA-binding domain-containing protein [Methylococcales bacterium]